VRPERNLEDRHQLTINNDIADRVPPQVELVPLVAVETFVASGRSGASVVHWALALMKITEQATFPCGCRLRAGNKDSVARTSHVRERTDLNTCELHINHTQQTPYEITSLCRYVADTVRTEQRAASQLL